MSRNPEKTQLYFRAQSLDNISDDIVVKNGEYLDSSQEQSQYEVVAAISEVVSEGTKLLENLSSLIVYCKESSFVMKAIPIQTDRVGRKAPIIIYGELPAIWSEDWRDTVVCEIKEFVDRIDRNLDKNTPESIREALWSVYQEYERKKKVRHQLKELSIELGLNLSIPLILALLINTQIPTMIEQIVDQSQNTQQTTSQLMPSSEKLTPTSPPIKLHKISPPINQQKLTLLNLEKVTQNIILWIAALIALNNVIMTIAKFIMNRAN